MHFRLKKSVFEPWTIRQNMLACSMEALIQVEQISMVQPTGKSYWKEKKIKLPKDSHSPCWISSTLCSLLFGPGSWSLQTHVILLSGWVLLVKMLSNQARFPCHSVCQSPKHEFCKREFIYEATKCEEAEVPNSILSHQEWGLRVSMG